MNKKNAYVLVPTILVLGALSTLFILQNMSFNQQLRARAHLIEMAKIDKIQMIVSTQVYKHNATKFNFDEAKVTIMDKQIKIYLGKRIYQRELLVK
ncbi:MULTISPECIES: hypothetical protein [Leuconostoc]|uniref:Late competence protein ComGG n=1 Tax=Leuconostoc suionicum TaxID=1511761 RepID=A0A2N9K9U1_9LACO|nr:MULTISPECIES: hypothetical protein [Leuconostoc]API71551.1 hypothetical protein A6B45_02260 [Leuconostoc suionicum]MBE4727277.1 hypothetical protein [Leuconostoc suionicum]MCT4375694.1 hypothetical protein [Leuconostoc suionicum]MCT4382134.1 hypothetical protein [Leuconostoc suionicum]MCT4402295.1 hypothetical protein [Leuconostoc suionicum]